MIRCPRCDCPMSDGCEQAVAIRKRGKCIACIVKDGETFKVDPYEFAVEQVPNAHVVGEEKK